MENLDFIADIDLYTVIEKITEGISGDDKYKLEKDGKYFLLRVGDIKKLSERKKEYSRLKDYVDNGINTNKPILFGTANYKFYSLVSWVNGISIMDIIKKDVTKNYYQLGKKVGIELKKLHLACFCDEVDWQEIIENKAAELLKNYHCLNTEFTCSRYAEQYITENFDLMKNRPQTALHGDFHWVNCVEDETGNIGIIDFSGNNIGDPWYDFGGLLWALEYSDSFANGQIDGYFGTPPTEFWKIFKFYTALYAFEHLTYSNEVPEDIKYHISNAERMLKIFGERFELEFPIFRK